MRVEDITIYPVKGFRGLRRTGATVEPWGLAGDRRWMLVDGRNHFLTQRQLPRMAILEATLHEGGLRLALSGDSSDVVPFPPRGSDTVDVTIFDDRVPAVPVETAANAWLSDRLGVPCRLVHMAEPAVARPVDPAFATSGDHVSFADGFPLLLTNAASLDDLNRRLQTPVPMDRFRANLAVAGCGAWVEDGWRRLRIGEAEFDLAKPCDRCVVPTVDQARGEKSPDNEPVRTLGTFRRDAKGKILFGQNLIPRRLGRVAVGDAVEVLA